MMLLGHGNHGSCDYSGAASSDGSNLTGDFFFHMMQCSKFPEDLVKRIVFSCHLEAHADLWKLQAKPGRLASLVALMSL